MKTNITQSMMKRKLARSLFIAAAVLASGSGQAQVNIAQTPLATTANVEPNVMFLFDDSGSMYWETMPDDFLFTPGGGLTVFSYPHVDLDNTLYGNGNNAALINCNGDVYRNWVPKFDTNNSDAAFHRSSVNNGVYYNPSITYPAWRNSDGTSMPDAVPTAAFHNPVNTAAGTRNLTVDLTEQAEWVDADGRNRCQNHTYYPATYFRYDSADFTMASRRNAGNYTRIEIRAGNAPFTGEGRDQRNDCATANSCSYAEEMQNFANWYSFYRSRLLSARGGLGIALADQPDTLRVGFGTINKGNSTVDGVNHDSIILGVRKFNGTDKQDFYDQLYRRSSPPFGTPLRTALNDVGDYFERADNAGPWGRTPGTNDTTPQLECRKNFGIIMTDGFWNGANPGFNNEDGTAGPTYTDPDGMTGGYVASDPFRDGRNDTLADTAMAYWKNDLRTDMDNRVGATPRNPAFWQHMVTYGVGFGVFGNINPDDAFAAIESGTAIAWGDPFANNPSKIDDLLHAAVNGRGGFFSARDPASFSREFDEILQDIIARTRSTTSLSTASTRLTTESLIYEGSFDSNDWSGDLVARDPDGVVQWRASEEIPEGNARNIFITDDGGDTGTAFTVGGVNGLNTVRSELDDALEDLYASQLTNNGGTLSRAQLRALFTRYIRGFDENETANGGFMRTRQQLLGDIVNSQPEFYGIRNEGWQRLDDTYDDFVDNIKASQPRMVYVGSNSGMLHAFYADRSGGGFSGGQELFAFVPKSILPELPELTSVNYGHRYYVDATPKLADAKGSGGWTTVLVAGTGAGARSVYALDVGDPDGFNASDVLWEIDEQTDSDLGHVLNQPVITRINDGRWVAIFGNGYNSANHDGVLFVVDLFTGNIIKKLDTGVGSAASPAGLGAPRVEMDPDTGLFAFNVFVGDLQGNMWKFDISSSNPNQWGSAYGSGNSARPLFKAVDPTNKVQPITAAPTIARTPRGGVFVYFGTGRFFAVGDNQVSANGTAVESFYVVFDDGNDANGNAASVVERGDLVDVDITGEMMLDGETVRTFANEAIDLDDVRGFRIDLEVGGQVTGEKIITTPRVTLGVLLFASFEPSQDACLPGGTPRLYVLSAQDGSGNLNPSSNCDDCGSIELDPGGPVDPPIVIDQPPVIDPDDPCFDNPGAPGCEDFDPNASGIPDGEDIPFGSSPIVFIDPITGERTIIGFIRDGRVAWGQKREL